MRRHGGCARARTPERRPAGAYARARRCPRSIAIGSAFAWYHLGCGPDRRRGASSLHAPAAHGRVLEAAEDDALDHEADDDHREQAGEHGGRLELIAVLEDEPAQPAPAGA